MNLFCSYFCFDFIGHLCATINRAGGVHRKCTPMTKRYTPPYYILHPFSKSFDDAHAYDVENTRWYATL